MALAVFGFVASLLSIRLLTTLLCHEPLSSWQDDLIRRKGQFHKLFFLEGTSHAKEFPDGSLSSWFSGKFQKEYVSWIEARLALRGAFVRTENQISYSLFREVSARATDRIIRGQKNWLFERSCGKEYVSNPQLPREDVLEACQSIKALQDALESRGITFLVVIAPSKGMVYPDYLPGAYLSSPRPDGPTRREQFLTFLEDMEVNHLDAHALLDGIMEEEGIDVFPSGGTHWNTFGSLRTLQAILERIETMRGRTFPTLSFSGIHWGPPMGTEKDLADLMNIWDVRPWQGPCPHPVVRVEDPDGTRKPNLLIVGDSFSVSLLDHLVQYCLCQRVDFAFYYHQLNWVVFDPASLDWQDFLLSRDVVILEMKEIYLPAHMNFVTDANRFLSTR